MVEAVAAFLGLFSTGIFVAHFVDAYADAAKRLSGETVVLTIPTDRKSLFGKFFTRRAA